jgi:phage major head subunit gpT-like protein
MLDDLFVKGLRTEYQESFDAFTSSTEGIVTKMTSTTQTENFAWLGTVPRMRVFDGERKPVQVGNYKYAIDNEEYEASMAVDLKDIDDDQTGKYIILARSIGESSAMFPEELLWGTVLPGGFSGLAYDGQFFYDTDHSVGLSGNQSNLITGKLGPTAYDAALDLFWQFKDDQGRPVNKQLDLVLEVPVALRATARNLILKERLADGSDNPYYQSAEVRVNPWLTDANAWYLINKAPASGVAAFVQLDRKREDLAILGNLPSSGVVNQAEAEFMRRKVFVGTYWRGAVGYGMFQKSVASTGATGTQGA